MASKSYGWDVNNIAKISPKMAKKQPFFDFFRFSQKLSIRFERNFLQLFYTTLESYMCNGIKIVWLGYEKHSQKWPKNSQFSTFFGFLKNCSIRFERNFLQLFYAILESYMCNFIKFVWLECEKQPNLAQKWPKNSHFSIFSQTVHTIRTKASQKEKDLSRLLYRICGSGFVFFSTDLFNQNFKFLKNCPYDFHEILHSHSTPKGAPACAKASKSYCWDVRNIAKCSPKMTKKVIFRLFSIFSKTVQTIRTKFSTVIPHHNRVLYVQWHQNSTAGM